MTRRSAIAHVRSVSRRAPSDRVLTFPANQRVGDVSGRYSLAFEKFHKFRDDLIGRLFQGRSYFWGCRREQANHFRMTGHPEKRQECLPIFTDIEVTHFGLFPFLSLSASPGGA
jgi:hypothetical protein